MGTRLVRGDSGAIFEVDASMLDDCEVPERGYRESSALPHASQIVRSPARDRSADVLGAAIVSLTFAVFMVASLVR